MRRIEQEQPDISQTNFSRAIENVRLSRSPGRFGIVPPLSEAAELKRSENEKDQLVEESEAWQRDFNRSMMLTYRLDKSRFFFIRDGSVDGDVAYLTDVKVRGLPSRQHLSLVNEREEHNRILLTTGEGDIAAIEFFNSSEGIDLRGITEAAKVKRQLKNRGVTIIIDPSTAAKSN